MEDKLAIELVQDEVGRWKFNVPGNGHQDGLVNFCGELKEFRPEDICAIILERLKQMAENYLKEPLTKAVISVTAYFNNWQRQATIDSGQIAGLKVLAIINEPINATLCYGMKKSSRQKKKTLVIFDLSCGDTFNVSVVNIESGKISVRSTAEDCHFGRNNLDNVDHCVDNFKAQHEINPSTDKCAMQLSRLECERAKVRLSTSKKTSISVNYLFSQQHFSLSISRTQFEVLCRPYFTFPMKIAYNQEVAVAIDQNGVGKQYYCLSDSEIRKKQAMLYQLQLEEQQYREMLVHKNHLKKVMFAIKSQLESVHSVIRPDLLQKMQTELYYLELMFINQDTCHCQSKKSKLTKEDIVKCQANLVRLYKWTIQQQFVQPIDSIIENQMHHHN